MHGIFLQYEPPERTVSVTAMTASPRTTEVETYFAPAGRYDRDDLLQQHSDLTGVELFQVLMDAASAIMLVLNDRRQIVAANAHALELLGVQACDALGKRPGEAIGCIHAADGPDGCGTGPTCVTCGAVRAIVESQQSKRRVTRQCRVSLPNCGAMDLEVTASRLDLKAQSFVVCFLQDIGDRKRRRLLERAFFHDIINAAGSIEGLCNLLLEESSEAPPSYEDLHLLADTATELLEEVETHRALASAESGDLQTDVTVARTDEILDHVRSLYLKHPLAVGRRIKYGPVWSGPIATDKRLLGRVLGNMVKNALEATPKGGTVTLGCRHGEQGVTFQVHNAAVMPPDVQLQVFQRSFSTKGQIGRGIGTHSMKLLGQRYLGGKVGFRSAEPEGTTFFIRLPQTPPSPEPHPED